VSASGLWVQTVHHGWLRADQVVQVDHSSSLGEPTEREVHVSVPVGGGETQLATYAVAYCRSDQEAKALAFSVVQCLATKAHVAGLVRVRQRHVEVTPFGELDPADLFE
jgi:hypothetical protein